MKQDLCAGQVTLKCPSPFTGGNTGYVSLSPKSNNAMICEFETLDRTLKDRYATVVLSAFVLLYKC